MNTMGKLALAVGAVAIWMGLGSPARAQMGMGGYGLGYGFLGNGPYNQLYDVGPIPYFSLYPPVYYSQPVPRTYGYSPFAYPPGFLTPEIEWEQPKVLVNPHVPQPSSGKTAPRTTPLDRTAATPKRIINPYVVSALSQSPESREASLSELVDNARRGQ